MNLKHVFFSAFLTISVSACAQPKKDIYTISGHLAGLKEKQWVYTEGDSAQIKNGRFKFTGKTKEPKMVPLFTKSKPLITLLFFVSNNEITTIEGKAAAFEQASITGPAVQTDFIRLNNLMKPVNLQKEKLFKAYEVAATANDSTKMTAIEKGIQSLDHQTEIKTKAFILKNPRSFVSAFQLQNMAYNASAEKVDSLFKILDPSLQRSVMGKSLQKMIATKKRTSIGSEIMEFSQPDVSGKPISMSSFRGKFVLLDFWSSWCAPCRAENPNVLKAYNEFKDKGFTVFAVSVDNDRENWLKAVKEDQLPWTQASDLKQKNEAAELFGIDGIPASFLIDPNGKIVAVNLRGDDLVKKLKELIK